MGGFPVQTTQPTLPTQPMGRPKKLYLIILIIILLIAATLVGAYLLFIKPDNSMDNKSTQTVNKQDSKIDSEKMSDKLKAALTDEWLSILTKTEEVIKDYENKQGLTQEEAEELE